ncbi:MAG: (d)CMP kinase [Candidatus Eisenbacteria bacterium]
MSFVVTIDGPSAAGKSTTARLVAERLGFVYVDTGALYRAVALRVLEERIPVDDIAGIETSLRETQLELSGSPANPEVWMDGRDVARDIRTPEVSELSSRLAALPVVRRRLVEFQRALRERGPLVAEGRDLGTVVYPDADVKVYLDADLDTRSRRRHRELQARAIFTTLDGVRADLDRRDHRDRTRTDSPLRPPDGSIRVDTSGLDIGAQVEAVVAAVRVHPRCPEAPGASGGETPREG